MANKDATELKKLIDEELKTYEALLKFKEALNEFGSQEAYKKQLDADIAAAKATHQAATIELNAVRKDLEDKSQKANVILKNANLEAEDIVAKAKAEKERLLQGNLEDMNNARAKAHAKIEAELASQKAELKKIQIKNDEINANFAAFEVERKKMASERLEMDKKREEMKLEKISLDKIKAEFAAIMNVKG